MSLDVHLISTAPIPRRSSGIFVRKDDGIEEITREEWDYANPGHEPTIVEAISVKRCVHSSNITHNLGKMAEAAGIYKQLWRPEEIGISVARELVEPLRAGLAALRAEPSKFKKYDSPNGWGLYEHFVPFVAEYLAACEDNPDATVEADR
jgi:hypothetical protein